MPKLFFLALSPAELEPTRSLGVKTDTFTYKVINCTILTHIKLLYLTATYKLMNYEVFFILFVIVISMSDEYFVETVSRTCNYLELC